MVRVEMLERRIPASHNIGFNGQISGVQPLRATQTSAHKFLDQLSVTSDKQCHIWFASDAWPPCGEFVPRNLNIPSIFDSEKSTMVSFFLSDSLV